MRACALHRLGVPARAARSCTPAHAQPPPAARRCVLQIPCVTQGCRRGGCVASAHVRPAQATLAASTLVKYGLAMADARMEGRWESKVGPGPRQMPTPACPFKQAAPTESMMHVPARESWPVRCSFMLLVCNQQEGVALAVVSVCHARHLSSVWPEDAG